MLGLDILGRSHERFPIRMVTNHLKRIEKPFATGDFAWQTFAKWPLTKKEERLVRRKWIEDLINICEIKNHSLHRTQAYWDDHKATPPLDSRLVRIPYLKEVAEVLKDFSQQYRRKTFCLSHTCEYYSKNAKAIQKRIDVIKDIAPRVVTVNSPIGGVHVGADILERHGDIYMPAGQGVSLDGKDATDVRTLHLWIEKNKNCKYTMLWIHSFNLRVKGKTPPPRPERTVRATKEEMNWLMGYF